MASMAKIIDYKVPVGVSLPESMVKEIDEKRGRIARSTYILFLLEKALSRRGKVA
jgi:metal-responsive CopG/Arc/MetJ family transcriptional regulator